MTKKSRIKEIETDLDRPEKSRINTKLDPKDGLSTGSTLLNLALSGMPTVGFFPKRCYRFIGKSGSGKTWLTLASLAQACRNKRFAKHRLIHDDPEDGALMDKASYFGSELTSRIEPPAGTRAKPVYSKTVDEYYYRIDKLFKAGDPFIHVLDSMDALSSDADEAKKKETYKARETGKTTTGTFGVAKAKTNSSGLRDLEAELRESDSIVIIISHAKVNLGPDAMFRPDTYAGGLSLKYFAHAEMWTSVGASIMKTVRGKPRKQGINVRIKVDKNRQTGQEGQLIELPILRHLGIDDVSSCIDYLIEEKHWAYKDGTVKAPEFNDEPIKYDKLVRLVEENDLEDELRQLTGMVWKEVDDETNPNRKNPYR